MHQDRVLVVRIAPAPQAFLVLAPEQVDNSDHERRFGDHALDPCRAGDGGHDQSGVPSTSQSAMLVVVYVLGIRSIGPSRTSCDHTTLVEMRHELQPGGNKRSMSGSKSKSLGWIACGLHNTAIPIIPQAASSCISIGTAFPAIQYNSPWHQIIELHYITT